jgi:spermidine/putrescine-binding protein
LTEVTVEEVPTLAKLFPRFQEFPYKNENETFNGVPWTWGFLGLTYSPERVEAEPESWEILLEPTYKDRVAVLDDAQNNIALAAVILGLNPDRLTQEEMAEVKEFLTQIVTQSKTLAASYGDFTSLMAAGEVDLIFLGWIGIDFFIEGAEAKTIVPNRGPNGLPGRSLAFSDLLIIPPDADNRTAALAFGEQVIKGKTAADAASFLGAGVTNPEVVPLLDEKTRNLFPFDDLDSFFERVVLNLGFPRGESEFVTFEQTLKEWDDIKSAAL